MRQHKSWVFRSRSQLNIIRGKISSARPAIVITVLTNPLKKLGAVVIIYYWRWQLTVHNSREIRRCRRKSWSWSWQTWWYSCLPPTQCIGRVLAIAPRGMIFISWRWYEILIQINSGIPNVSWLIRLKAGKMTGKRNWYHDFFATTIPLPLPTWANCLS